MKSRFLAALHWLSMLVDTSIAKAYRLMCTQHTVRRRCDVDEMLAPVLEVMSCEHGAHMQLSRRSQQDASKQHASHESGLSAARAGS
ncbi:hypothetical protein PHSY_003582 [Pseudozyma hubeiensis SY62]|uniref:Secreted protein n=1 Tax=Pseudozyma hubeiensis (strain SY62) TaxID=1305764 RepID=R9P3H7_PSEHS|nr:hypothetical protein PHSY_003582 [Pseudozyma hubeiensis SY62]GAC96003.1 hypothetical protein PHSY_003582 [Pseudozyma hubeiensis SY62]